MTLTKVSLPVDLNRIQGAREIFRWVRVHAVQAWGPESRYQQPCKKLGEAVCVPVTPVLRMVETGGLLGFLDC